MFAKCTFVIEYRSLHREVRHHHDRVVGVVQEVVAGDLDVRVDAVLQCVRFQIAPRADLPVSVRTCRARTVGVVRDG